MMEYFKAVNFQDFILCTPDIDDIELIQIEKENLQNIKGDVSKPCIRYDGKNYLLYEWKEYYVIGKVGNPLLKENFIYIGEYRKNNTGVLFYKNFIGDSKFRNQHFIIESEKMKTEEVYKLIDLVDERIQKTISLNFSALAISRGEFIKNMDRYKDFYVYQKLYSSLKEDKILPYIKRIQKFPNRFFEKNKKSIPLSIVENISEDSIIDIFSGESLLMKTSNSKISSKFFGMAPESVNEYYNIVSIDTNENRFVKFFIQFCVRILSLFIDDLSNDKEENFSANILLIEEVQKYRDELQRQIRTPFFNEVSSIDMINHSSTILTRQFGYKQIYQEFINLKKSPINIFDSGNLIDLFENKSIDKLYEYICLFRLIDILEDIYSKPSEKKVTTVDNKNLYSVGLSEENGEIEFVFKAQGELPSAKILFQHSFTRANQGSYSVEFKPDFTLQIKRGEKIYYYHFDSKFRINKNNESKNEDIVKMHSYKDGISYTVGAFVLFPGKKEKIFLSNDVIPFSGVGAFPLNINHETDQLIKTMLEKCLIFQE